MEYMTLEGPVAATQQWRKQAPLFILGEENEMSKYFVRDTPLEELERMMMTVPNYD